MIVKNSLRDLTKKIVVGVAVGGAPILTVGCAAPPEAHPVVSAPMVSEKQQVAQLLASRDPQAIDSFLAAYPASRYNVHLLNSLPPGVLAQLSGTTVAGLPPQVTRHLTRRTRAALARISEQNGEPDATPAAPAAPSYSTPDSFGSPGGGGQNGGPSRGSY